MRGHNIWFRCEIREVIIKYSLYLELCINMAVTLKDIVSVMNLFGPLGKCYANYTELRACQLLLR